MIKNFILVMTAILLIVVNVEAQVPTWCYCYGGYDDTGAYWNLLDYFGSPLKDGDLVYAAWTGPDGEIDPPALNGQTTDDDQLVWPGYAYIEGSMFFFTVTVWPPGDYRHPTPGELIYCRIFDAPREAVGPGNFYGDSQTYEVQNSMSQEFFCLFPGDPGEGHTDTRLFSGTLKNFTILGGLDSTGTSSWPMTDIDGQRLQDGDLVQLILVGPNSEMDPMDELTGMPSGDDSLLITWGVGHGYEEAGTGLFEYDTYTFEADPWEGYLAQGDQIYLRVFDDSVIGEDSGARWYGESPPYEVVFTTDEKFYSFPDSVFDAVIQAPWYRSITIYGGVDSSMGEHPLTDSSGHMLEDGDLVELIWAGADGEIDPINELDGMPTGDDSLLTSLAIGAGYGEDTGLFKIELQTFSSHAWGMPANGDVIYLRVFSSSALEMATYYGESETHTVISQQAEDFFAFPDDADDAVEPLHQSITIYGGTDSSMGEHPLTDYAGAMLEDGDLVQLIWAGPGESIDAINETNGMPTGDDSLLTSFAIGAGYGEDTGLFKIELHTFSGHAWGMPANGDVIYLRVFSSSALEMATYYGESETHTVISQQAEDFFAFPDDADDAVNPMHQTITIFGGSDSTMVEHPLTDSSGVRLEDGDMVQLIWAGADGSVDAINETNGMPTGDDSLLTSLAIGAGYGEHTGLFKIELHTFSGHAWGMPANGDVIYLRVFNRSIIKYASHYGVSDVHTVRFEHDESFFPFPDNANDCVIPNQSYTSVEWADGSNIPPVEYALLQNYPNPFNTSTDIKYAIPMAAFVEINVYNIRGEKVATLVDDHRAAGFYTARWDAETLASGIYFCRLQAGEFGKIVKMVLLK